MAANTNVPAFLRHENGIGNNLARNIAMDPRSSSLALRNRNDDDSDSDESDRGTKAPRGVRFAAQPHPPWPTSSSTSRSRLGTRSTDVPSDDGKMSSQHNRGHSGEPTLLIDPLSPQDVTVHMSLPVQDDLEEILEECSRLRRLGHFTEAIALFRDHLSHFLDNRYVLIQYAQCLYEAGQHAELERLAEEKAPPRLEPPDALQLNWDLLLLAARRRPQHEPFGRPLPGDGNLAMAVKAVIASAWPKLDSSECQVLALLHEFEVDIEAALPSRNAAGIADLYAHLIDQGMVWEFRDVLQAHLIHSLPTKVLDMATPKSPSTSPRKPASAPPLHPVRRLRERWSEAAEDESTLFALLDVFTTLSLQGMREPQNATFQQLKVVCVNAADECGSAICALDDAHLMTRPCLRWIMAKRMVKDDRKLLFDAQTVPQSQAAGHKTPGFRFSPAIFPSGGMPVYDPLDGSIPHWNPASVAPRSDLSSVAHMVLQAAEALGDLNLQTACLQEMMYRGTQPPERVLSALHEIWSSTGNKRMLPSLNLFRAVLAHTPSAREALRRDLLLELGTGTEVHLFYQLRTLAALTKDPVQQNRYRDMAEAIWDDDSAGESHHPDAQEDSYPRRRFDDSSDDDIYHPRREGTTFEGHTNRPPHSRSKQPPPPIFSRSQHSHWDVSNRHPKPLPGPPTPSKSPHTESTRDVVAKIKTDLEEMEHNLRHARELRILRNKLKQLELDREQLEMGSPEKTEGVREEHNAGNAPAGPEPEKRVEKKPEPLPKAPSHSMTVEDYPGTSDSIEEGDGAEQSDLLGIGETRSASEDLGGDTKPSQLPAYFEDDSESKP